jgi:hypothetical protein
MGFDYINSQSKMHTKSWNDQFMRSADNLFSAPRTNIERTFIAKTISPFSLPEGEQVYVRKIEGKVLIFKDLTQVCNVENPSLSLMESLNSSYGMMSGVIVENIDSANLVLIKVVEGGTK